ncbi:hypothetical protein KI387_018602 [Taxus chinensis]|uniref:Uncharacterized protein n=1 Tax=Taxus chinensis TaxID=29808 RepID=A0AA38L9I3_TAXCH|nr:hypothetical protein KI387_018602 [Taxus chinensis]
MPPPSISAEILDEVIIDYLLGIDYDNTNKKLDENVHVDDVVSNTSQDDCILASHTPCISENVSSDSTDTSHTSVSPTSLYIDDMIDEILASESLSDIDDTHTSHESTSLHIVELIMETLGAVTTVNTDLISKMLPFIFRCFDPMVVQDYKVGGLMVVGTLAGRATLSEKLVKQLLCLVAKSMHKDVNALHDISLFQMALMVMIKLTQSQSIAVFPWKALEVLASVSDLAVSLAELSKTFYAEKFLLLILDGLVYYSFRQKPCQTSLISIIDAVPMEGQIVHVVSKILGIYTGCSLKTHKSEMEQLDTHEASEISYNCILVAILANFRGSYEETHFLIHGTGTWTRCVLLTIEKIYPAELDKAVCNFLEISRETTKQSVSNGSVLEVVRMVFNGSLHIPMEESNASVYISLEHPQPQIRAAAVSSLATLGMIEASDCDTKTIINIQEALLRRLHDDDLSVVRAALSLEGLARIIDPSSLLKALNSNLSRCFSTFSTGSGASKEQAYVVADLSLEFTASSFLMQNPNLLKKVAAMILPYSLILPKTWKLNQKALQLAGKISWPFFNHLSDTLDLTGNAHSKKLEENWQMSVNSKIIGALSDGLLENPGTYLPWLIECCGEFGRIKPLLFLILIHSFMQQREGKFWHLLKGSLPLLKQEWSDVDIRGTIIQTRPNDTNEFFSQPEMYKEIEAGNQAVNGNLLVAIFWSLLKNFPKKASKDESSDSLSVLEDLFVLFAMSSYKEVFKEHIQLLILVTHSALPAVPLLSKFFMAEGLLL